MNSQFVLIYCEWEPFLLTRLFVDGVPNFMYVQVVSITGKGEDNGFFKKREC